MDMAILPGVSSADGWRVPDCRDVTTAKALQPQRLLERLLAHNLPLVMPLCLQRVYPFAAVQYTSHNGTAYVPINPNDHDESLIEVVAGAAPEC